MKRKSDLILGIDNLIQKDFKILENKKIGLTVNQASFNNRFEYTFDILLNQMRFKTVRLFAPQHGLFSVKQANMIESNDYFDETRNNIRVVSLYGKDRRPKKKDLIDLDAVVIDLFDIGTRFYTYIWTMALLLEQCEKYGIEAIVLDRPNPLNGIITEGNIPEKKYLSFVGLYPIPVRFGLTIGELANFLKCFYFKKLKLEIIKLKNYNRKNYYTDYNLYWHYPSPNMPSFFSAFNYPSLCLLEATNISEGRGTTVPFEMFGAAFINAEILCKELNSLKLPGVYFRPIYFCPTFDKFKGKICGGAYIHISNREKYRPYYTGIIILNMLKKIYPKQFKWYDGPYEYEYKKLAIDILTGTDVIRKKIEKGENIKITELEDMWYDETQEFLKLKKEIQLYK